MSEIHPRWNTLLRWLQQRGMNTNNILVEARRTEGAGFGLYAVQQIPPSTPLFQVPAKAMMNIRTLVGLYPKARPKLTATQVMSLHLLLHRPCYPDVFSKDPIFGPYISVLPSNFHSHPLTWVLRPQDPCSEGVIGHDLLEHIPKGVLHTLEAVAARFRQDWERICRYLVEYIPTSESVHHGLYRPQQRDNPSIIPENEKRGRILRSLDSSGLEQEFLWGWINVNTRCIYRRLSLTRQDRNITMCPILDFANHTNNPEPCKAELYDQAFPRASGDDLVLLSPKDKSIYPGEEVFLKYGAHSNRTLFTEYGFVGNTDLDALGSGQLNCEADITWRILRLFASRGVMGTYMEQLLRSAGYWGEWTIHSMPEPAHPSFRLISALRLYHAIPRARIMPPHEDDDFICTWRDTICGDCDTISPVNESSWREMLDELCLDIDNETRIYLDNLNKVGRGWPIDSWIHYMRRCLLMLWHEQQHVAWCVHQSLEKREEF